MIQKNSGGLLVATLLIGASTAFCGVTTTATDGKSVVVKSADANPLSFYDGLLTLDIQERVRGEYRENNYDFNSAKTAITDDSWLLNRFRIGALYKPASWLRFYVQGQDSREIGSDRPKNPGVNGAEGDDTFDLRQAYVEFSDYSQSPFSLKVGRQILSYGDERLIGAFDWNNIGRTFDAVKFRIQQKDWSLDAFVSTVVVPARGKFNQSDFLNGTETHRDQIFSGLYFTSNQIAFQTTDVYALFLNQANTKAATPVSHTDFATLGTRIKGDPKKLNGFEYDGEYAVQFGTVTGKDLLAFATHTGVGYNWFDVAGKPRLYLEYNYASGDSNAKDDNVGTFQNLFPTNHKFYGYMDLFSWQNLSEPAIWFRVSPTKTVNVELSYHAYWLATTNDSWYRANGVTTVRPVNARAIAASSFVGSELDLKTTWAVSKNVALEGGYSHFFAGQYLKDTGPHSDADFGYLMATLTF